MRFEHGYALLIGVDQNSVAAWALPGVGKDLQALAQVLTHEQRCAYLSEHVHMVTGPQATRDGILAGLDWLQAQIQADAGGDATAVIYYSGHGWCDESTPAGACYLIPYDVRPNRIHLSALRAADLAGEIARLQPRRLLVVLDCCHAGGMGVKGASPAPAGYAARAVDPDLLLGGEAAAVGPGAKGLETLSFGSGRAVLCSSTGSQSSYMRGDGAMSVFTYHLIEALTGHAAPQEGATEVLVSDVMSYVSRHVPASARAAGGEQMPDYRVSGNFALAMLLGGKGLPKGASPPDPFEPLPGAAPRSVRRVDTGGGAYVEGNVRVRGGDFVGRDQIVYGDHVRGDKVMGDKVAGDKITVGDTSGSSGVAIGRNARVTVSQAPGEALAQLFAAVYRRIEARLPDPDVEPDEIVQQVRRIEDEAARGAAANAAKIGRWLGALAAMDDDVYGATVGCLLHPAAGVAESVRQAVQKARRD